MYQIRIWLSTLQEPVGSCPSEHSLPSCGSDARGASGAVSDVVGEACDCHCVALVVLCVSHYTYLIVTSQAHCLAILTTDAGPRLTLTVDYPPAGYVSRDYRLTADADYRLS